MLLASELLQGWSSPTLPAGSAQEQALLQATVDAISAGKGASDDSAVSSSAAASASGSGRGFGGAGKGRGRKKAGSVASSVVASKYTQPGRYHLLQLKKKAAHKRKAAVAEGIGD